MRQIKPLTYNNLEKWDEGIKIQPTLIVRSASVSD